MRADICVSDDHDSIARLLAAIAELGGQSDGDSEGLGTGLHRFRFDAGELTVFVDAWSVDVAGPDKLVNWVLTTMCG